MRFRHIGFLAFTSFMSLSAVGFSQAGTTPACGVSLACNADAPVGESTGFFSSTPQGSAYHYGRDFFLTESEDQWVIARFQYGNVVNRQPLVHEEVQIQLLRDCGSTWENLGRAFTSAPGENTEDMGTDDNGGWVFFKMPESQKFGLGRHRIRLVVSGDQSATELFLEVLPAHSTLFVSDVDGTLTTGEYIDTVAGALHQVAPANPGAAALFRSLVAKGYHPLYLTARASNLTQRTRDFISTKKFPAGVIDTNPNSLLPIAGIFGISFKAGVIQSYIDRGFRFAYGFGNTSVDAGAFAKAQLPDDGKYFFNYPKYTDYGTGTSFTDYTELTEVQNAPNLCQ
ncbi:MAG: hypothetical protein H7249_06575 [Chitinophagaceae bacterium]|nr:hypothetical protein [Oligoflexus sp.]